MSSDSFSTLTLSNGLRVIGERSDSPVVYCGYVMRAGTRHEDAADSGMAHFIEHMSFKGTRRRTSWRVTNDVERLGGELNAFTSKQETVYYATALKENFAQVADVLTDIVFASVYRQQEIDKEVEVICDEIDSYKDSPSELIFDEFESMLFPGQPLGRDVLGEAERLHEYTTADALRYTGSRYLPANAVFYVYGDVAPEKAARVLEKAFDRSVETPSPLQSFASDRMDCTPLLHGLERSVDKQTHQAHVLVGGAGFGGTDDRRFALVLLNNVLAGPGMNSRLNTSLRERAGLVYTVEGNLATYPDTGYWNIYFGCDAHDVGRCRRLLRRELDKIIDTPFTPARLTAAKRQLCAQIAISCEAKESYAVAMGKTFAHYGRHRDVPALCERIMALAPEEVQRVAAEVYAPERISTLIYH